jgi:hypothetical protein
MLQNQSGRGGDALQHLQAKAAWGIGCGEEQIKKLYILLNKKKKLLILKSC